VPTVEGSLVSASRALIACRLSSSSLVGRTRSASGRDTAPAAAGSGVLAVGRLARLGWTRIGSPGIFGERNPKALFRAAKLRVADGRK
jgi:hypothetical protein